MSTLQFSMGRQPLRVVISDSVIQHIYSHRQAGAANREAGGGLFMCSIDKQLTLSTATGPYPNDSRSRTHFRVDVDRLNHDVQQLRQHDHYFVGMWHTHPVDRPVPSELDVRAMQRLFCNNLHSLSAMLMMIVGRSAAPGDLWVSLHTGTKYERLMVMQLDYAGLDSRGVQ